MATTIAKAGQPIRNNGAVIPRGGTTTAGSPVTSSPDNLTQGYRQSGVGGTNPISKTGANIGTSKAVNANTFARNMVAGQALMFRYGHVAGSSSTFLNTGAADYYRQSIYGKTNRRSYHITSWNYETGVATKDSDTNDSFGADNAATPTRAIPGELQYFDHGTAKVGFF